MEPLPLTITNISFAGIENKASDVVAVYSFGKSKSSYIIKVDGCALFQPGSVNLQNIFFQKTYDLWSEIFFKKPHNIHINFVGKKRQIIVINYDNTEYYVDRNMDPDIQYRMMHQFRFMRTHLPKILTKNEVKAILGSTFGFNRNLDFESGAWNEYGVAVIAKDQQKYYFYFAHPEQVKAICIQEEKIICEEQLNFNNKPQIQMSTFGFFRAISEDLQISYERVFIPFFNDGLVLTPIQDHKDYINGAAANGFTLAEIMAD